LAIARAQLARICGGFGVGETSTGTGTPRTYGEARPNAIPTDLFRLALRLVPLLSQTTAGDARTSL